MSCDGCVALPRGAMGLSAVCDCGISWSYSLTILARFPHISSSCHQVSKIRPLIYFRCNTYTRGLWKRITIFLHFSCNEKLLAGFNVQPRIGMNQSLISQHYHATLLMTSHGYIQHPAPFCTNKWNFLFIFMFKLWRIWCHATKRVYRLFLIKSNW